MSNAQAIIERFEIFTIKNGLDIDAANKAIAACERAGYVTAKQLVMCYAEAIGKNVQAVNNAIFAGFK